MLLSDRGFWVYVILAFVFAACIGVISYIISYESLTPEASTCSQEQELPAMVIEPTTTIKAK